LEARASHSPSESPHRPCELLESVIKDGEWVRIEKRDTMPINGRVFVIELDVTAPKIRMVGVLVEADH